MASNNHYGDLICTLCNDVYKTPKLLPCLHTFCQDCLSNQYKLANNPGNYTCHTCKETFNLQEGSIPKLQSNTKILALLGLLNLKKNRHTCVMCTYRQKTEDATTHCLDCGDMMCKACSCHHTYTRLTLSHRVVELTDIRCGKHDDFLYEKLSRSCYIHPDMVIKFYCKSCIVYLCDDCSPGHQSHDLVCLEEADESDKVTKVQKLYDDLKLRQRQALDLQTSIKLHLQEIEGKARDIPQIITNFCNTIGDVIEQNAQDAKDTAATELLESKRKLVAYKSTTDTFVKTIAPICDMCTTFSSQDHLQRLPVEDILINKLSALKALKPPSLQFSWRNLTVDLHGAIEDPMVLVRSSQSNIHSLSTKHIRMVCKSDGAASEPSPLPVSSYDLQENEKQICNKLTGLVEHIEVNAYKLINVFSVKLTSDELQPKITSVAWLTNDSVVVSDRSNNHISLYNTNGCCLWSQAVQNPLNVACIGNVIACSSNNDLFFYKNNQILTRVKTSMSAMRVTRTSDSLFLVATPSANRMETFNTNGEHVGELSIRENVKINMLSSNGKCHVASDWSQNSIVLIDKCSGQFMNRHSFKDKRWGHPGATCADDQSILVADYHMNKIHVLSKEDGAYLQHWSLEPSINHPISMSYHSSGHLLVGGACKIAIYTQTSRV